MDGGKYVNKRNSLLIPIIAIVLVSLVCLPVSAGETDYDDPSVTESLGVWNSAYNRASEVNYDDIYRCVIIFTYSDVATGADDYWINIDYDGEEPGFFWNQESLKVEYRWSNVGSWTFLCYYTVNAGVTNHDITTATSSTLYLRFSDCGVTSDTIHHTWYFGDEPILTANWE
jgi:hypothetical protein